MRTPQLTAQYGQVERVSVARAILSSLSCATAGVRSNPRREKPAPPASAPLRKVLRENSIAHPPTASNHKPSGLHPKLQRTIIPSPHHSQWVLKPYAGRVACRESKPHNRPVAISPWQRRIRRAEHL